MNNENETTSQAPSGCCVARERVAGATLLTKVAATNLVVCDYQV